MPCDTHRRRLLVHAGVLPLLLLGGGCSRWFGPRVITLDEDRLAELIDRAFPRQQRVLEVLDIELGTPRLRLLPETNRLALAVALRSRERLLGTTGHGQFAFDCVLRYAAEDASLRLSQVRVRRLRFEPGPGPAALVPELPGVGSADAEGEDGSQPRIGRALAERVLEDLVVYRLGDDRLARLRQAGLQPGAVTVTSRGVEITLTPTGG